MRRSHLAPAFYGGRGFSLYHASGSASRNRLAPHFHDEYLICAQLRGREHCHVAGKLHQFCAGDVALINPQQVHTGNTEGEDVEYISLYVDRAVVVRLAGELAGASDAPEFTLVRAADQPALVDEMCELLARVRGAEAAWSSTGSDTTIDEALRRVVIHAFEEFSNLRAPLARSTSRVAHRKIARALEYMRALGPDASPEAVSLDRLAEVAELSKYHFLRQFDQVVGMTPGAYLRTLRLCQAARMLRASDTPILDVATAIGFADHPSFSRAFARHMGMTPSEYRRLGPL